MLTGLVTGAFRRVSAHPRVCGGERPDPRELRSCAEGRAVVHAACGVVAAAETSAWRGGGSGKEIMIMVAGGNFPVHNVKPGDVFRLL